MMAFRRSLFGVALLAVAVAVFVQMDVAAGDEATLGETLLSGSSVASRKLRGGDWEFELRDAFFSLNEFDEDAALPLGGSFTCMAAAVPALIMFSLNLFGL